MNAVTEIQDPLLFTESAANKVKQLIEEEGNSDLKLRVFVHHGVVIVCDFIKSKAILEARTAATANKYA